jgi:hypothetical protein
MLVAVLLSLMCELALILSLLKMEVGGEKSEPESATSVR